LKRSIKNNIRATRLSHVPQDCDYMRVYKSHHDTKKSRFKK